MKRSIETNTNEQNNDRNEHKVSRLKKAMAITSLVAASAGIGVGVGEGYNAAHNHKHAVATQDADARYNQALEKELKSAYEGPVEIDQAENTDRTTMKFSDKRGIINLHIDGSAKNKETAESKGTPDYMYSENPTSHVVSIDGEKQMIGAIAHWKSTQEDGDAVLYPRLANFAGSKPTTFDYKVELGAEGIAKDGHGGIVEENAEYDAGDVLVTGSHGKITGIDVVPRPENEPPVEITQLH